MIVRSGADIVRINGGRRAALAVDRSAKAPLPKRAMPKVVTKIERTPASICAALGELGVATVHEAQGRTGLMATGGANEQRGAQAFGVKNSRDALQAVDFAHVFIPEPLHTFGRHALAIA